MPQHPQPSASDSSQGSPSDSPSKPQDAGSDACALNNFTPVNDSKGQVLTILDGNLDLSADNGYISKDMPGDMSNGDLYLSKTAPPPVLQPLNMAPAMHPTATLANASTAAPKTSLPALTLLPPISEEPPLEPAFPGQPLGYQFDDPINKYTYLMWDSIPNKDAFWLLMGTGFNDEINSNGLP